MHIEPAGACALQVLLDQPPSAALSARLAALAQQLRQWPGIVAVVPAWDSLLLHYDLQQADYHLLVARLCPLLSQLAAPVSLTEEDHSTAREHRIAVCYDHRLAPDLPWLADACGLSEAELIAKHHSASYRVGAIGFAPGFAYLAGLDPQLAQPRRATPRTQVPAGSVAVAEQQCAIYPQASPGGWHLIGRTTKPLFEPAAQPPSPWQVGDRVRFFAIDYATYLAQGGAP